MYKILLAGFGGQGILFAGKQLATAGMKADKNVTWLPSYGPEMRGGTCNCSVIVSDTEIGSPLVDNPNIFLCFNLPSYYKFESKVEKDGIMICDSSLISEKSKRTDIKALYIPATELADKAGLSGKANVVILGYLIKASKMFDYDFFKQLMVDSIKEKKPALAEANEKALVLGYNYEG
ncbi:MAG: 2-oxoacid:acceptor oxidoreductase family protein [Firmicutes bacterium]|nr:2-oxoacid:acceptor oxidoreductase family protein [Bacillota bacterium]